jgi:hypothetical protein
MNIQQMEEYNNIILCTYIWNNELTSVVEQVGLAITLLDLLPKVLGSNLGRDTGYPEVFMLFLSIYR